MTEFPGNEDIRKELAFRYIRGNGIEIGVFPERLDVPPNAGVRTLSHLHICPEIEDHAIISAGIVDDAEKMVTIGENEYDFCIANRALEYTRDPEGAILAWLRVLKPGGILYISFSDVEKPLQIEHTVRNHSGKEYPHLPCIFSRESLNQLLSIIGTREKELFRILETCDTTSNGVGEHIFILEKDSYTKGILKYLESFPGEDSPEPRIDVIVPVYNAYEEFTKCLFSLIKHHEGYRILVINDGSTDEKIGSLLSSLKKFKSRWLEIVDNGENIGYVKTINKGIGLSRNDVILLNSDTIVTSGWARKLEEYAYKTPSIATVTPLTNNGTICSVPVFLKENPLPAGFTIDGFGNFIENVSFENPIELPTGVGFCMFIRRNVIDRIGTFDDKTFGRGYGEENDFCFRAVKSGFTNILCDNTFVYHRGSSSFSTEKSLLIESNLKKLSERYPDYLPAVALFCETNPLTEIHNNIHLRMGTWNSSEKEKRVLVLLHDLGGGTEKYTMDLITSLGKHFVFYIVAVSGKDLTVKEINNGNDLSYRFTLSHSPDISTFYDREYRHLMEKVIATFGIDLVHVHHVYGHTLDIFAIAKENDIPALMTLHDYYCACPAIFPTDEQGKFCKTLMDTRKCDQCLQKRQNRSPGFISEWRTQFQSVLRDITCFIANDQAVFDCIGECYSIPEEKRCIIEPGHTDELIGFSTQRVARQIHSPVVFGYIGVLERSHKGMDMFYALSRSPRLKGKTRWKIIGVSEIHDRPGRYPEYNVEVYGRFKDYPDLHKALSDVDIVIQTAPCETYGYTVSEAWAFGLPVLVADTGVLRHRVDRTGGGWIVDVNDVNEAEKKILEIISSGDDYSRKVLAVHGIRLNPMKKFQRDYLDLYRSISSKYILIPESRLSPRELYTAIQNAKEIQGVKKPQPAVIDPNCRLSLPERFVKCMKEHGPKYTISRVITYFIKGSVDSNR